MISTVLPVALAFTRTQPPKLRPAMQILARTLSRKAPSAAPAKQTMLRTRRTKQLAPSIQTPHISRHTSSQALERPAFLRAHHMNALFAENVEQPFQVLSSPYSRHSFDFDLLSSGGASSQRARPPTSPTSLIDLD
jgi:hypothetical protein